ncbi:three-helix bundle dimerization domain-containing protein [Blastococcus tunisiensis]|uniref:Uncharacterized protein n=1 Tax=Blastococcus tunisiensis TaxID=1798228 RepID=A0A1I2ELE9_9ACTN|nr:hypothetical protein [Blastococcus sp. DSM 46838]SFE93268.1 hypothetical protein SAMN05216574_10793 [Blastococcus sp. DSM 46838]
MADAAELCGPVAERLEKVFPDMCPVVVEASVRVARGRLAGARVEQFMPVLVERVAADSLRQLSDPDW